ncbi:MAG: Gfo/Idh/MocA family oxidoreductase [Planctomycetota bacterium]
MAKIRFGVIGCGGMGTAHLEYLVEMRNAQATAMCDIVEDRAVEAAEKYGGKAFVDHHDLLDSGLVDAVIIATPHYDHPPIAVDAFERGIHVISEKPLGVTLSPVDRMLAAAKKSGCVFSVMYQNRSRGHVRKVKKMLEDGTVGEIIRVYYLAPCYRSQAYWESDAWRGRWATEGGGVLVNQAPHSTDLLYHLCGRPSAVLGRWGCRIHNIEVEDQAEAFLTWPNGATGYYATAVNESPTLNHMRIVGDNGILEIRGRELFFAKYKKGATLRDFTLHSSSKWGGPGGKFEPVEPYKSRMAGHRAITHNTVRAINGEAELISPGEEGINQVEITCALFLSGDKGKPVSLPVDRDEYDKLMRKLIRRAKGRSKKTRKVKDSGVKLFE